MSPRVLETRAPTPADLDYLALHLRQQDLAELKASGWEDPRQALEASVNHSKWTLTAHVDKVPVAVFGCAEHGSLLAPVGVPWMLGTEGVRRHQRVLQRWARLYIAGMLEQYPRLLNAVHAENTVAIAWLRRLGFAFRPATPSPTTGAMFHLFEMSRDV